MRQPKLLQPLRMSRQSDLAKNRRSPFSSDGFSNGAIPKRLGKTPSTGSTFPHQLGRGDADHTHYPPLSSRSREHFVGGACPYDFTVRPQWPLSVMRGSKKKTSKPPLNPIVRRACHRHSGECQQESVIGIQLNGNSKIPLTEREIKQKNAAYEAGRRCLLTDLTYAYIT